MSKPDSNENISKTDDVIPQINEDDVIPQINEEDEDEGGSNTPMLDLVKNQKPHEFGEVTSKELGVRARDCILDMKSNTEDD